jgi:starvation-inducible DNA-binding protein
MMKSELLSQAKNQDNPKYKLATNLAHLLADTYLLELKTQNFHWNIEGPQFYHLHLLLETQYIDLQTAGDVIAELC